MAKLLYINKQLLQVAEFNQEVLGIKPRAIGLQDSDELKLSIRQMREEILEFNEAAKKGDVLAALDALLDLEYYLYGVLYKHGVDEELHEKLFDTVHKANMLKKAGVNAKRGKHGDAMDAQKPEEWTDPTLLFARIIEEHTVLDTVPQWGGSLGKDYP